MSRAWEKVCSFVNAHHLWCVLSYLVLLEVLVFAPIVSQIGFYLDDWGMLSALTFAPGNSLDKMLWFLLKDSKTIIRPIEALHFGALFALAGTKPALWHIFNGLLEVVAAWLLYLCVHIASKNKLLSLLTAALFLLCPTHDCTHYWVLASSATLSMACWLGSLACTMVGTRDQKVSLHFWSFLLFCLSVFNYEIFVPLAAVNVLAGWWFTAQRQNAGLWRWPVLREPISLATGFAGCIALYWVWARLIVPKIGIGYIHPIHLSAETMIGTVMRGIWVSLPFEQAPFYLTHTRNAFDTTAVGACLAIAAATGLLTAAFNGERLTRKQVLPLLSAVAVLIPVSYTIFGLSPEYTPTLLTIINRINYGSSLGTCLLYALVIVGIGSLLSTKARPAVWKTSVAVCAALLLSSFVLSDRAMAKPWALSWTMQKHVAGLVRTHEQQFTTASCVMLLNSPRYVMWAPVFDGTWDFENLARVTLRRKDLYCGVVSERLNINQQQATDVSSQFVCGKYPFQGMIALVAPQSLFIPIGSADEFIHCVQTHGFGFGLDRSMPAQWRQQLIAASNSRPAKPY